MTKLRSRLTYANLIATLALFLALGGGAYAAVKLPKNSVGGKQIKANAVSSGKVKDGSLKQADFGAGELPAGPAGANGTPGRDGTNGTDGTDGAPGETVGYAQVSAAGTVIGSGSSNIPQAAVSHPTAGVYCFAGAQLPANTRTAMVASDNAGYNDFTITSVSVGSDLLDCDFTDTVRVRTVTVGNTGVYSAPGYTDQGFLIWFED
jgi:hypothetical protein